MQSVEKLQDIGLTKQEAQTYLALVELGETKTGQLCKRAGIASSNIYHVLDRLIDKGLASYRVQNNVKIYMPAPPEALNELFEQKRKQLQQEQQELQTVIADLQEQQKQELAYSDYKYFETIRGVKSMWREINNQLTPDHTIKLYTEQETAYEKLVDFWDEHFKLREQNNIPGKMIFPRTDPELANERESDITDVKFTTIQTEAEWGVYGDTLLMHHITGDTPHSFLIHDEKFAETFEHVFDKLWEQADETP